MKRLSAVLGALVVTIGLTALVPAVRAAITLEQRKEVNQIKDDSGDLAKLIRDKKYDEANKLLNDLTAKLDKIAKDAELKSGDKMLAPVQIILERHRQTLAKLTGAGKGSDEANDVSFVKQIAPLINSKCASCHDEKAAGKLRLDSYAAMKEGGKSGVLLAIGQPQRSLIMARLTGQVAPRMPKDGAPLTREELELVGNWIKQGAKFDGEDENEKLADTGKPAKKKNLTPVKINKATGKETVSFIKDIAPDIVGLCTRCHSGTNPRSGFRVVTFEDIMRGGDSGAVIEPGSLDNSRLWELVSGGPPKMPPGQIAIRRSWYQKLEVWIKEGAKFDGDDPKVPLAKLVPTEDELKRQKLSRLTPDEFLEMRKEQTRDQWKRALAKEEAQEIETAEFYLYGNVGEERLKQISGWAEEHAKALRTAFKVDGKPIWHGKLAVIVYKDRFGYSEFSLTINNRETDPAVVGHSVVTIGHEEAYIVLLDVGDTANAINPDTRLNLIDQMTGAFLKREGKAMPEWLIRGTGLAMATKEVSGEDLFFKGLRTSAAEALRGLEKPDDLFGDGKFSPSDMAPIGFTLVSFMLRQGSVTKFVQFVGELQKGTAMRTAVSNVYKPATAETLAIAYLNSLGNASGGVTKKKTKGK